nr:MAG TPA: hypothetical protein [Caudoviricetes sp.]
MKCDSCPHMRHCLNGRWCSLLLKYVEYLKNIECDYDNNR